ncbi:cytochrome P450 [Mycena rebaudengoi]|nr:cytochrome P450 [Mycena rebaudengoi]
MSYQFLVSASALGAAFLFGYYAFLARPAKLCLPPGPKGYPLIGNLLELPRSHEWLTYSKWATVYGQILHLNIMGQPMIILSAVESATDLLDKRSSTYSDRPHLVMAGDLVGFNLSMALSPYNDRYRHMRRLLRPKLSKAGLERYWPLHEEESKILVRSVLKSPSELLLRIRLYAGAVVLKVTYGYRIQQTDSDRDPWLERAAKMVHVFSEAAAPGAWICDIIPAIKNIPRWFPGAGFHKQAAIWRKMNFQVQADPYTWSKSNQNNKDLVKPNLISTILDENINEGASLDEDSLMWAAGSLFGAGSDTTVSAISTCCLVMALFPDVQDKAQEELDRVVGRQRLPTGSDIQGLPYITAVITEVLRWRPVAPLGLPHRSTVEDEYQGYRIPKGTLFMVNVWHIMHDPLIFPEPEQFKPERFLDDDGQHADIVYRCNFGFGRRACPGRRFAEGSIFIALATILATCKISDAVDDNGSEVEQEPVPTSGGISHPSPFTCKIVPRHETVDMLLSEDLCV